MGFRPNCGYDSVLSVKWPALIWQLRLESISYAHLENIYINGWEPAEIIELSKQKGGEFVLCKSVDKGFLISRQVFKCELFTQPAW